MHIPNGVLDPTTTVAAAAASASALTWSAYQLRSGRPRMGIALGGAGGLLVAHLADVPLYGPYTSHLIGGTLLAIAVGPWLALVTMTTVLAFEAFLLGDGGTAALGANVLVMGVAGVLVGYGAYRVALRTASALATRMRRAPGVPGLWARATAGAIGAWLSVMASALTLAGLVAIGGTTSMAAIEGTPDATVYDLLPRYAAWGLLEATLTGGVVAATVAWSRSVTRIESAVDVRQRISALSR
jgi:cobalt/nickel transport system permease protein